MRPLLEALAARGVGRDGPMDVAALSMPGRAGSNGPPLADVSAMAALVRRVMDALGWPPGDTVIAGHSLGGGVALELALAQEAAGEPLSGLALMCTGARLRVNPAILALYEAAARTGRHVPSMPMIWAPGTPRSVREAHHRAGAETPPDTALVDWRAADGFDRITEWPGLRDTPTVVVAGERDGLTPAKYAAWLVTHIDDAALRTIEGAGHMAPMERPNDVATAILDLAGVRT
jgi:pimeloyl-ACP methyl ester carboxylesterase